MAKKHSKKSKNFKKKRFLKNRYKSPHKSFKRSYREDYIRDTKVPGIMYHIFKSFGMIFKNWRLFVPLLAIAVLLNILFVGLMSESNYVQFQDILDQTSEQVAGGDIGSVAKAGLILMSTISTGGLSGESSEAAVMFGVLIFLIIWLTTIFLLRHRLAGHKVKLRDGLYNATTPLISTFVVFAIAVIQCVPIFLLIIVYSAAVSAPGLYPLKALNAASDLMMGRRIKFILRVVALILVLAIVWVIVMLPLIVFDLWMKTFEWTAGIPFIPVCLNVMTCFTGIYVTTYLYLYYRWMLNYDEE